MRFWDSSAVISLLVGEADTERRRESLQDDPRMAVWWGCKLECASALNRRRRDGQMDDEALTEALDSLEKLAGSWYEVQPSSELRARALCLLRVHPLKAADAAQLAAALIATAENTASLPFLTPDDRLREAARKEGFPVD